MDLDILKFASDTKNMKKLENFTHSALKKNPMCGDYIKLKINLSCIYCQASASLITKNIINKNLKSVIQKIKLINKFYHNQEISIEGKLFKIFNKKNYKRKNCIYLPINAIVEALKIKN